MNRLCILLATLTFALSVATQAQIPKLGSIPLRDIDGKETTLLPYAGKVLLIVNVASECGHTPQYAGLEYLWRKYRDKGLVVLGFPSNDFGGQEPGTNADIKKFCTSRYEVTFPIFEKMRIKGSETHPLFSALTGPTSAFPGEVQWNFGKFLVGRTGQVVARFDSDTEPESAAMLDAIENALRAN